MCCAHPPVQVTPRAAPEIAPARARRRASPPRTAAAAASTAQSFPMPRQVLRRFTHASIVLPDSNPVRFSPGNTVLVKSGSTPPPLLAAGSLPPPPAPPTTLSRPIRNQRVGLDPDPIYSEPSDPDPRAQNKTHRFGLALFLKRPSVFPYSTRSPPLVKSIRSLVQKLAPSPLSSIEIEPAVQTYCFYELDPRVNV